MLQALPFFCVLLGLAVLPGVAPHLWEAPGRRLGLMLVPCVFSIVAMGPRAPHVLQESLQEYVAFMALLMSLYGVASGIVITGGLKRGVTANVLWLALGGLLASGLGTTGASMLLVRPFFRAQAQRTFTAHTVVFFIFIVSNVGGMLLPLGDPPLYLGFLKGVPFAWTLRLAPMWGLTLALLLALFAVIDAWAWKREPIRNNAAVPPLRLQGSHNLVLFALLVALVALAPRYQLPVLAQAGLQLTVLLISWACTKPTTYRNNGASIAPMVEVATVFLALFVTMPDALAVLHTQAQSFGALSQETFFWLTGSLSAVLDNAPCYLAMATLAQAQLHLDGPSLTELASSAGGGQLLLAIAAGSVTMGAMTYVGNGPNLMVRAVAQEARLQAPSFVGYLAWSGATLLPIVVLVRVALWALPPL